MKNTITRKLLAAAAAIMVTAALTGCFAAPQQPADDTANTPAVSAGDVISGSDVSGTDVSGSDVSGSDVKADMQSSADLALEAYLGAFNNGGDAKMLADLTCSPAMNTFLENNGLDKSYLVKSFQNTIDSMKQTAGGAFAMSYSTVSSAEATEEEFEELVSGINSLAPNAGENVQEVRIYKVAMSAESVTSSGDVISSADAVSDQAEGQLRLYKYADKWYVFGD